MTTKLSRLLAAALFAASPLAAAPQTNPLLAKWTGPYGGVPAFDRIKPAHFKPALESAMAENLREIDAIANDPTPPTFDNTIAALERAGRTFGRVTSIYGVFASTMDGPEFQAVERELSPKLAEFNDKINQNRKLFERVSADYEKRDASNLTPEQRRLVWLDYTGLVRAGAKLEGAAKERVAAINKRLATLSTSFNQNLLGDENDYVLFLEKDDLAGLPD